MTDLLALFSVLCIILALAFTVVLVRIIRELWRRYGDRRFLVWGMLGVLAFNVTWIAAQYQPEPVRMVYPAIPNIGRFIAPKEYRQSVMNWCGYYGVPLDIGVRFIWEESRWNSKAVNKNKNGSFDFGLCQLNSFYFPKTTVEENIEFGIRHFKEAWVATGSLRMASVGYNAGIYGARNPPVRSLKYADRVVGGGL